MLDTRNVIEVVNDYTHSVRSFPNTEEGQANAEELYVSILKENGIKNTKIIEDLVSDGYWIAEDGTYSVSLITSLPK